MAANPEHEKDSVSSSPHIIDLTGNEKLAEETDLKQEIDFEDLMSSEAIIKLEKIGRYGANVCVNVINIGITNMCLLYTLASSHNDSVKLHIVACVLGYQLCMNQGILIMSKYNSWSIHFSDDTKITIQWYLQAIGCVLITGGSVVIIFDKRANIDTPHGIFGVCALVAYLLGYFNDRFVILLHFFCPDFKSCYYVVLVQFIHYATGILAILFYCVCLCYGFKLGDFEYWAEYEERMVLMVAAYIVTVVVIMEFINNSLGKVIEILETDEESHEDDDDVYNEDYDVCAPI